MDNERQGNLLLAIALSLLVMIGWGWLEREYIRPPEPPAEETITPDGAAPAVPDGAALPVPAVAEAGPGPSPADVFPEPISPETAPAQPRRPAMETTVETPHLHLTFSTRGGAPQSLTLPRFAHKAAPGAPVQLIAPGARDDGSGMPPALTALTVRLPGGTDFRDADHDLTAWHPGETAHGRMREALTVAMPEQVTGTDPAHLREIVSTRLREAGLELAVAWALAAVATDVPLSTEGQLQQGWSTVAQANVQRLGAAHVLDYRLPLPDGAILHKVFVIDAERYGFDLAVVLESPTVSRARFGEANGYTLAWGPGIPTSERSAAQDPLEGVWVYKSSMKHKGLGVGFMARVSGWLGTGPPPVPQPIAPPAGSTWFGMRRKYFMAAVLPFFDATSRFVPIGENGVPAMEMQIHAPGLVAAPGEIAGHRYLVATTPVHRSELEALGHEFDLAVSFGWFRMFGRVMLSGLLLFNSFVHNYGLAIILLTVLVRLGLFPLNQRAYQSMRAMGLVNPKITELRERYKNDPQEMNKRIWELYREHNINPIGGCLPMFLQMPVFFALFNALRGAIELRGASFLWISDMSEPDRLAELPGGFSLNILPLLMIGAMLIQQRMSTPPPNPGNDPNVEMQRKMMQYMPLMFGVMFYGMPAGLTLYWLVSTVLGIGQQYYVNQPAQADQPAAQT